MRNNYHRLIAEGSAKDLGKMMFLSIMLILFSHLSFGQATQLSPIGSTLTSITNTDDYYQEVSITSTFSGGVQFGANVYTSMFVGSNGYVTFGVGNGGYNPTGIAGYSAGPIIAAQYDDLHPGVAGDIYYSQNGSYLVVTFSGVAPYCTPTMAGSGGNTFQIVLRRGTGYNGTSNRNFIIEVRYINMNWAGSCNVSPFWPTAGWSTGTMVYGEMPYSGTSNFLLNQSSSNVGQPGVYSWEVLGGTVQSAPTVNTTNAVSSITGNSGFSGGNITADGGLPVTERGLAYSTSQNPTISNSTVTSGTGIGSFTATMTGLSSGTTYYVRAYATNSMGTAYGPQVSFTTTSCGNPTNGGSITGTQSGCAPFTPATLNSTALPSGHIGTLEYRWQSSTTGSGSGFSDISSSNTASYSPGALSQTTWFKRIARVTCATWTGAAESNVIQVTVEPTPVAGTLTKTPNVLNVCENDIVSAVLTAGSGGNGTDELQYRTNNGAWTAWATYTSAANISTTGLSGVEIRTRRQGTICSASAYTTVSWSVEATPVAGTLTKTPNVLNVCENDIVSATFTSGAGGNGTDELEYRTNNGVWSAWTAYTSAANISTSGISGVEIRTRRTASTCASTAYVTVNWIVEGTSVAGVLTKTPNVMNVCENDNVSAALTAGTGGNGTDELQYRTNNGTWSAWAAYTSASNISTTGLSGVEIRTRRIGTQCATSGYVTVSWSVEPTPVAGSLIKNPNENTVCEGELVSAAFTSGSNGNGLDELEYRTRTGATWSIWVSYTSGNQISTNGRSGVEIRTRRLASTCSPSAYVTVNWIVEAHAVAGSILKTPDNYNVCEGDFVSALLMSGTGGNGTDDLDFRTNNGSSWTAWSAYTQGTNISTSGIHGVEMRTRRNATYCDNSTYSYASWLVEQTPVNGILVKNPDAMGTCITGFVSAILIPGEGGNGIDDLQYRSSVGSSWSIWMPYTSGNSIAATGKSGIEIRTRRAATYCATPTYSTISWSVELTPIAGSLTKTPEVMNVCENDIVSATLTSGSGGNGIDELEFRTSNGTWSAWAAYISGANISTADVSGVEIRTRRTATYCENSAYTTVGWTVEATPLAGTLAKTPNVVNVCENDIVSATLTSGSGGNGIDELEFRTNNGTWSAWATYTSGTDISTADLSGVEIRTRRTATYCENSAYTTVGWTIEATPIAGTLAKTPNVMNVCENDIVSAILTSGSGGNGIDELEFRTNNGAWTAWATYTSAANISTTGLSGVEIRTRRQGTTCSASAYTTTQWNVNALPEPVITGPETTCENSSDNIYSTESAMTGYTWNVSAGGVILSGAGTHEITVAWETPGFQTVSVNYTNSNSCTAIAATTLNIEVVELPSVNQPGNQVVCNNSSTAAIEFTGTGAGTIFNWENDNTSIGLAGSGTGDIASFIATNLTSETVTATITVTPNTNSASNPEILYYKFDGIGTTIPNLASNPPSGAETASIIGTITQGGDGICDGTLIGSEDFGSTNHVNTGWNTNLTGTSWTISFKTANITPSETVFYIFGEESAGNFRCFTNGVAGSNNWILRGPVRDINLYGGATMAPHTNTFVYDIEAGNIKAYLDGVLVNTVAQPSMTISGSSPFKIGAYGTSGSSVGINAGGLMDEFRIYNRALSADEILDLVDCSSETLCSGPSETFTITVEATPIAGLLSKTPNVLNVCENDIVSATLTSGSGGNGIDELEFRTNNGTWSAWATYTSGTDISTADLSGVEIRTRRTATYCENSAYTTVGWTIEATPIAGTLAKTPNVMNVCENDIVSATLTAGNGGNGIDELEFRTSNGTWSAWAAYTSGANISTADVSGVEIRTRRTATYCESSAYVSVSWNVEATPIAGTLAKTPNVMNVCENDIVSATLTAGNGGNGIDELEFRTSNGTWSAWAAYISGANISTADVSGVEIRTRRTATYCENSAYTTVGWTIEATPIAGTLAKTPNVMNVCENDIVSATLTAGNGGNGIDELEFRTNNGAWSAWAAYTSGANISTADLSGVEIRTRRTATYCESSAYTTVSWTIEATPIAGTLAKTPNILNVCENDIVSATLTAGNGGNSIDELEFRTNDGSWSAWAAYISGANISTADVSGVEIRTRRTATYCENSAYTTVGWTVEATPIAGTLAKTPNVMNVCENDIVSAILTSGNGGNGIDELEFRTNDGSWSAWAAYTSGANISTADLTGVEIRTRRTATYCENSAYTTVSWTVEATPIAGTLAKTPNVLNVCENDIVSATLTAGNGGNGTDELEFRTNDGSWSAWAAYTSGTNISTADLAGVEIRTRRNASFCSASAYTTVSWTVEATPIAGTLAKTPNVMNVCENDIVSATLTSGNGGNGIDELEFRTNDGSWSAWAAYTSGANISTADLSGVEIRTRRIATYCENSAYTTVGWTVEATPIAGTLAKTPNVMNVCENDIVSATLTSGNGGNGIDELEFRTNDGSWSAWAAYTSGANISTADLAGVEIRTRRTASFCSASAYTTVGWTIEATPIAGTLAKTPNVMNVCENDIVSATLTAGNGGNGIDELEFRTNNGTWSAWAAYTSGANISCWGLSGVEIRTRRSASTCEPSVYTVATWNVNPLPVPVINGSNSVCLNSTGHTYSTAANMTNYSWAISAGGTITAGANTNTITVNWNATGEQSVSVNYINENGCTAQNATIFEVTVNPLPLPSINGRNFLCAGTSGEIYTTEPGMTNYSWTISDGGIITSGALTNTITVTWNNDTSQGLSVNYINENGCTAPSATFYDVTVASLPVPTITGPAFVCAGESEATYTTQSSMSGYDWSVSPGGVITSGNGTNQITITWNTDGPQTVSVNYTNANGCTAENPSLMDVTVRPMPTYSFDISATEICSGGTVDFINYFTGEAPWTVVYSYNGVQSSFTTSNNPDYYSEVFTETTENRIISVTDGNSCTAMINTVTIITVNPLPVPTISGAAFVCEGATGETYTTESGMTDYNWAVSEGGTITSGAGTNTITVDWSGEESQTVSVVYTNENGCSALNASVLEITMNPLPQPVISGPESVCAGTNGVIYTTDDQMSDYNWTISSGGSITSGNGTHEITVHWYVAGNHVINVNYTNSNACTSVIPGMIEVEVNPLPAAAGTITGTPTVCAGTQGMVYSVPAIANASICFWTLPEGAEIVSGFGTNSITVDFNNTASSGIITVRGANSCGQGAASPIFQVQVNPIPEKPVITQIGQILTSSATEGNQWFFNGIEIPGATSQQTEALNSGEYSVMVTLDGCNSQMSDILTVIVTGTIENLSLQKMEIYPNPNHGEFTLSVSSEKLKNMDLQILTSLGVVIYEKADLNVQGKLIEKIKLSGIAPGIYFVKLSTSDQQLVRKVVIH